jgi:glycosyltransferase involved in cell wall biosynthesis
MRIAQVAPLHETVPPEGYGGTERVIAMLCAGLTARGHDVALFAAKGSTAPARLVAGRDRSIRSDPRHPVSAIAATLAMLHEVRARQADFDVIHCHISHFQHFPFFEGFAGKTLTTPHGRLDYVDLPAALACWPDMPMSAISDAQRRPLPQANWRGTILHGLPADLYRPGTPDPDAPYLAFLGRFSRDKRADRAVAIARGVGLPLRMAAKIAEDEPGYFEREIAHLIDGCRVIHVGEVDEAEKSAFLGGAAALLFPIDWPEPFGLVAIEAMAHGTPVVAWREGAMDEVVDEGVTGFVVDSIDDAIAATRRALTLDRTAVRQGFLRRFDADRMVEQYLELYARLPAAAG